MEDEGTYICNATNRVGYNISEPIDLQVMVPPERPWNPWLRIGVIIAGVIAGLMLLLVILCAVFKYRAAKAKKAGATSIDVTSPIHVDGNFVVRTGDNTRINIGSVTMGSGEDLAEQIAREQEHHGEAAIEEGRGVSNGNARGHVPVSPSSQACSVFLSFHPEDNDLAQEMRDRRQEQEAPQSGHAD
ncbi:uncharacterized protein [Ptychodera flava]|uniref:uncharacterized protein n=1 Tax=Ptychodera flava TaxID=63121 RepID=UPI00396A72A1